MCTSIRVYISTHSISFDLHDPVHSSSGRANDSAAFLSEALVHLPIGDVALPILQVPQVVHAIAKPQVT